MAATDASAHLPGGLSRLSSDLDQAAKALSDAQARLRAIFDHAPVALSMRDLDGRIVDINRHAAAMLGRRPGELLGQDAYAFIEDRERRNALHQADREILRGGRPVAGEEVWTNAAGAPARYHVVRYPVLDLAGEPIGIGSFAVDLTDRLAAETQQRHASAELATAQRLAGIGSWTWDPATDAATWSAEMYRLFGRDPGAGPATSEAFFEYVHHADRERLADGYAEAFGGGPGFELEYRICREDGVEMVLHALGHEDPDRPGHYTGTVQDVTRLRSVERELRESEERLHRSVELLRGVFDRAPIGEALVAPDGTWLRVNAALCALTGYSEAELLAASFQDITHPDDLDADLAQLGRVLRGDVDSYRLEKRYVHKQGHEVWVRLSVSLVRDKAARPEYVIAQVEDISEIKAREDELIRERATLSAILENVPAAICVRDLEGRFVLVNPRGGELLGASAEVLLGQTPAGHLPDAAVAAIDRADGEILSSGRSLTTEWETVTADGSRRVIETHRFSVRLHNGQVIGTGAFGLDVTEQRESERVVHAAREHAETIVEAMAEGYALTVDGEIRAINTALTVLTGFGQDELLGARPPYPFWPAEQRDEIDTLRQGIVAADGGTFELELQRRDGSRFAAELTARPARDRAGTVIGFVTTMRDVSERRRHEAEIELERRNLRSAQAIARLGSWEADLRHGGTGRWSPELWEIVGLPPAPGAPSLEAFLELVDDEDRRWLRRVLVSARSSGRRWEGEFRLRRPDGRRIVLAFHHDFETDSAGRPVRVVRTLQDVTARAAQDAEHAVLGRLARLVAENAPPSTVMAAVARELRELFGAHSGAVMRFDVAAGVAEVVSGSTADGRSIEGVRLSLDGDAASAQVYRTGRPVGLDGAVQAYRTDQLEPIVGGAVAAAPIRVRGELWGTVGIACSRGEAVDVDGLQLRLSRFAEIVAMAIANAQAWESLSRLAATDPLTGLANHRAFYERLDAELRRARRYERELSVVLFDLDHFKAINDEHGHPAGDRVLARFGAVLADEVREGEIVARIGGEEFAWLLPETDRTGAVSAAERVRASLSAVDLGAVGPVTVSAGVSTLGDGLDAESLVAQADQALYAAKDLGRNRTCTFGPDVQQRLARVVAADHRHQAASSVRALARAIDSKDSTTAEHSERVAELAERMALGLGWTVKQARLLHACGLLHDIGKIGIPDEILLRPGPLTPAEYEQIKRHPEVSAQIAAEILEPEQVTWVRGHHERWDGRGYPDGLAGEEIPAGAQLLALADAWDVMTQARPYKAPRSGAEALAEVRRERARQFAPRAVEALERLLSRPPG